MVCETVIGAQLEVCAKIDAAEAAKGRAGGGASEAYLEAVAESG